MNLTLLLKGAAMGMAEAIPGVSGGTIAFITGIYERLLNAIQAILGPGVVKGWREGGLAGLWRAIDGNFLLQLGVGMVAGLVVMIFGMTELLERFPPVVWAFFFGLIIASAVYIGKQVEKWTAREIGLLIIGCVFAFALTVLNRLGGTTQPLLVFLSGALAISALILPGISGSFILLLLGMYAPVFNAMRGLLEGDTSQSITVGVFMLGCLVGLAVFSRLLSWTFKQFPNQTLALLTGFMLGSLNKLWPWQNVTSYRINSKGEEVADLTENVMPGAYEGDSLVLFVILAFVLGLAIVGLLDKFGEEDGDKGVAV
ncbi:MAG: DUF368 domain-containing protein [Bacteroidota bacterium]